MKPDIWGEFAWKYLHLTSLDYPEKPTEKKKKKTKAFLENLVLPCDNCQGDYEIYLRENPLTDDILNNKKKLVYWLVDLHNIVNLRTGSARISYDEFLNIYDKLLCERKKKNKNHTINYVYFILLIIVVVMCALIVLKKLK